METNVLPSEKFHDYMPARDIFRPYIVNRDRE